MTNAERWTAVLEVQMLELFAEALEDVRPAVLKRLQAGPASNDDRVQIQRALGAIAVEAASHFERVVASRACAAPHLTKPSARSGRERQSASAATPSI